MNDLYCKHRYMKYYSVSSSMKCLERCLLVGKRPLTHARPQIIDPLDYSLIARDAASSRLYHYAASYCNVLFSLLMNIQLEAHPSVGICIGYIRSMDIKSERDRIL